MADEELSVEKDAMFRKHRRDKHSHAESARSEFQKKAFLHVSVPA